LSTTEGGEREGGREEGREGGREGGKNEIEVVIGSTVLHDGWMLM